MTLKQMFLSTLKIYRKNFIKLFVPVLLLQASLLLPILVFTMPGISGFIHSISTSLPLISSHFTTIQSSILAWVALYSAIIFFLLSPYILCSLSTTIRSAYNGDITLSLKESFSVAKCHYKKMLRTYLSVLLVALPIIAVVFILIYPMLPDLIYSFSINSTNFLPLLCSVLLVLVLMLGVIFVPYVVVADDKKGIRALFSSFKYVYKGNFPQTLGRLALAAGIIGVIVLLIRQLSSFPFDSLLSLYLEDPLMAFREPLMLIALSLSGISLFFIAIITPFWYVFSYHTYCIAKKEYHNKQNKGDIIS